MISCDLAPLRARFEAHDVVALDGVFSPALIASLGAAVARALDAHGVRRDVRIAATGGSQRRYRIAAREALAAQTEVAAAYRSPGVMALVAALAGEPVFPVPYAAEEFLATRLEDAGDVHGWHWDDYAYALVWVLRAPDPSAGAAVELIRDVPWDKADPRVAAYVAGHPIERFWPQPGVPYLLRAHGTLHRVAPLRAAGVREMLCFSYANAADLERDVSHETLEAILA